MSANTPHFQVLTPHHDFDRGPRRAVLAMLALIAVMLAVLLLWMNFASLDISVRQRKGDPQQPRATDPEPRGRHPRGSAGA